MKKNVQTTVYLLLFFLLTAVAVTAQDKSPVAEAARYTEITVETYTAPKPVDKKKKKKDSKKQEKAEKQEKNDVAAHIQKSELYPVLAYDSKNELVKDLTAGDIAVFVNGTERPVTAFRSFGDGMNVVLMFDNSNSTSVKREEMKKLFGDFIDLIRPQDGLFLVSYDETVKLLADDKTPRGEAKRKLEKLDFGGGTSLYDAVDLTLSEFVETADKPTAVVLLTDGVDTTSRKNSVTGILQKVERANAVFSAIYHDTFKEIMSQPIKRSINRTITDPWMILLPPPVTKRRSSKLPAGNGMSAEEYKLGVDFLNGLTNLSGGRALKTDASTGEYKKAFEFIYDELQNLIFLGFEPVNEDSREIKIRINRPGIFIRTKNKLAFEERR